MLKLYGFPTMNPLKVLYTATHLGLDFEFVPVNLMKGENKSEAYRKIHPLGKVPAIEHNGETLFESGAICRYLATISNSPLYPQEPMKRAHVDQWMDFFTAHLGRWLAALYVERVIRPTAYKEEPNEDTVAEALGFIEKQAPVIEEALAEKDYLPGPEITIADYFGFAYVETTEKSRLSLDPYPQLKAWYERIKKSDAVQEVHKKYLQKP